jgi:hypothetical protein
MFTGESAGSICRHSGMPPRARLSARTTTGTIMTTKTDCLAYLSRQLIATGQWRRTQASRWPNDPRNEQATKALSRLSADANEINDNQWGQLKPLYKPRDNRWCEAVARCSRDVGFRSNPESFADYVQTIIEAVAVSA